MSGGGAELFSADYGPLDRLLHRLALSSSAVGEAAFQVEKSLYGRRCPADDGRHVFVAGLARAGTTLLLRLLYDSGEFSSLTYRDMPFVLAPNLWRPLAAGSRRKGETAERAHGDGVLVDVDSPEALEEVFWRVHCGASYLRPDRLVPMTAGDEVIADFRLYVRLILLRHGGRRYLSKNNNNILRLAALAEAFPRALVLIPFRHPLDQAGSLRQQHLRFTARQGQDAFELAYMNWLAHHEFGLGHRPFLWPGESPPDLSRDDINYWLWLWTQVYGKLLGYLPAAPANTLLFSYDRFCDAPAEVWRGLAQRAELAEGLPAAMAVRPAARKPVPLVDSGLLAAASALYEQLTAQALCPPAQ